MDMFFVIFLYFPVMMAVYTINGRRHQFYTYWIHVFKSIFTNSITPRPKTNTILSIAYT